MLSSQTGEGGVAPNSSESVDVEGVCVCVYVRVCACVAGVVYSHVALVSGVLFPAFTPCFLQTKSCVSNTTFHQITLKSFPYVSIMLEQIFVFKTSVRAELTVLPPWPVSSCQQEVTTWEEICIITESFHHQIQRSGILSRAQRIVRCSEIMRN